MEWARRLSGWRVSDEPSPRVRSLAEVRRRWQRTLGLAVVVGTTTGFGVALFDLLTGDGLLTRVLDGGLVVRLAAPGAGLVLAALALRWLARGASPSTADEYIRSFHDRHRSLPLRPVPGRVAASVATLGLGGAMGFEGPSIYLGASIGAAVQRRFHAWFERDDAKTLMVAGAAAGVAAIFKAPATGAIFALEVPYHEDLAARAVLPALVASATSYLAFASVHGTTPILSQIGNPQFSTRDLAGAALLGLACGGGARLFARMVAWAKAIAGRRRAVVRVPVAAAGMAGLVLATRLFSHAPLSIGAGYHVIVWVSSPRRTLPTIAALFAIRVLATGLTVGGGGVGGLFVPLVVLGAVAGRFVGGVVHDTSSALFLLVGMAAFLGAGYRTPLAAVMFVAESTGRAGFVVPGLIVTAVAVLVMGERSVSPYQQQRDAGLLERRLRLPIDTALVHHVHTVGPETPVDDMLARHFPLARARSVPVVSEGRYLGMVRLEDVEALTDDERAGATAGSVMRVLPAARAGWTLRQAVEAMGTADVDRLAVCDGEGFVGVVTTSEILRLQDILEETQD